jgi:hypothetical protein
MAIAFCFSAAGCFEKGVDHEPTCVCIAVVVSSRRDYRSRGMAYPQRVFLKYLFRALQNGLRRLYYIKFKLYKTNHVQPYHG